MPHIDPSRIAKVDTSGDISPDGTVIPPNNNAPEVTPNPPPDNTPPSDTPADEPAAPASDDNSVDFTAFLDAKSTVNTKPEVEPAAKPADKKDDQLKSGDDDQPAPPEDKTKVVTLPKDTQQQQRGRPAMPRDYSDVDEADVPLFKNMSNEAFNKLKPVYKEHRLLKAENETLKKQNEELSKGVVRIPESYYENPRAFALTPEFDELTTAIGTAQQITAHWENQLVGIREGKPDYDYLGIRDGKFYIEKRKADARGETDVMRYYNGAQQQEARLRGKVEALIENHQTMHKSAVQWAKEFQAKALPLFDKEEQKAVLGPMVTDTINKMPATFRSSPLAPIVAKMMITLQHMANIISKGGVTAAPAKPNSNGKVINPADVRKAGPTGGGDGGGAAPAKGEDVSMDDFQRVKDGY